MSSLNRQLRLESDNHFAMVPRGDVPRSSFGTAHKHLTAFDAGLLIPFFVEETLPGDVWSGSVDILARLNTLLFPMMNDMSLETFFFSVPDRIIWGNSVKMHGERDNPADSIAYTTPQINIVGTGAVTTLADYFGIPVGNIGANNVNVNALPFRAYWKIMHDWFRDQNLTNAFFSPAIAASDGPDTFSTYASTPAKRAKKHDYFTSATPTPQKATNPTSFMTGLANIVGLGYDTSTAITVSNNLNVHDTTTGTGSTVQFGKAVPGTNLWSRATSGSTTGTNTTAPDIKVDMSTNLTDNLNTLRLAVATQQLLEKDMRGGTRYVEHLFEHWGVTPQDARLQRAEYIGGGKSALATNTIPQTSATGLTGGTTAFGSLSAQGAFGGKHSFYCTVHEHGWIIGLIHVTGDIAYQQGLHRKWTRLTRLDRYLPVFANIGEQPIQNREIYCKGDANDTLTFGYQEAWASYRYRQSLITGKFNSKASPNIDEWHLAQEFTSLPALNDTFIRDGAQLTVQRALAAAASADGMQILCDTAWRIKVTRAMPTYSVPGLGRL